jgi:hypothetical protein
MKFVKPILFCFIVFLTTIFAAEDRRLILYFDINKTLIATDKATNKTLNDVLNELLSEKYVAKWDEKEELPISFEAYARKITSSRNEEIAFKQNFIPYLEKNCHELFPKVLRDYESALEVLNSSQKNVFPSFYALLDYLDKEKINYSIILRSFGVEVLEVKEEIETLHPMTMAVGKFQNGVLIENGQTIDQVETIYQHLKSLGHAAIQDDWSYWNAHHEASAQGKPFLVDLKDSETLPIFFDDNIRLDSSRKNIIAPLNALNGELLPIEVLSELKYVVRVKALEAILDRDYYINHVKEALSIKQSKEKKDIIP